MILQNNIIRKIKLINVKVVAASRATEFFFEDQPDLRGAQITALSLYNDRNLPKTYENTLTINLGAFDTSYLTMYDMQGFAFVDKAPAQYFVCGNANNTNIWGVLFNGQKINWSKCFLHIADQSTINVNDDEYFQVLISYEYPKKLK